jgi:hypothetical protein
MHADQLFPIYLSQPGVQPRHSYARHSNAPHSYAPHPHAAEGAPMPGIGMPSLQGQCSLRIV